MLSADKLDLVVRMLVRMPAFESSSAPDSSFLLMQTLVGSSLITYVVGSLPPPVENRIVFLGSQL